MREDKASCGIGVRSVPGAGSSLMEQDGRMYAEHSLVHSPPLSFVFTNEYCNTLPSWT